MAKAKITKKSLTEELKAHGFMLSPCITSCNAGDLRVYRESGKGYYATINFVGGKLKFNGQVYDSVDAMLEAIEEYNNTLEFDPDTYNPDYDMNCVTDMRSIETLKKCGYDMDGYGYSGRMKFTTQGVLGVKYPVVNGEYLNISDSSFIVMYDKNDSDSDKAKKTKSFIGAMYAANLAHIANKLADMGALDTLDSVPIKTMDIKTLQVTETEGIDAIISILENSLSRMKKHKKSKKN